MSSPDPANDEAFDNRAFWNQRYIDNPALGSGVGSRGANLAHKRAIIADFLQATAPRQILDVGCGDHEVLSGLDLRSAYLGIDVADVVVAENKRKFPGRDFQAIDFSAVTDPERYKSDAVFCFEVLIHQHKPALYHRLIANLVRATGRAGIVSGYITNPRPTLKSSIIAWHEPITESLREAGAQQIKAVATSLESDCLAFVSFTV